jgi:pyruvoyl-dependent arginine decarboxylase (PvlArgDC)
MTENKKLMGYIDEYKKLIERKEEDKIAKNVEITDKAFILNENINSILSEIENTKEEDILE